MHSSAFGIRLPLAPPCPSTFTPPSPPPPPLPPLIPTPATLYNLRHLASTLALTRASPAGGRPVLVEGPPGCGKTRLVRHLAALCGQGNGALVELHLDDATDGRTLLGAVTCTDVPGQFEWQPGTLTSAARAGRWVLIEDIDRAPFDVLAALAPLLENRSLVAPGQPRALPVHPSFQLFATRSAAAAARGGGAGEGSGASSGAFGAFADLLLRVALRSEAPEGGGGGGSGGGGGGASAVPLPAPQPNASELAHLLAALHPTFPPAIVRTLLAAHATLRAAGGCSGGSGTAPQGEALPLPEAIVMPLRGLEACGRPLTPRDALRWAARLAALTALPRRLAAAVASAEAAVGEAGGGGGTATASAATSAAPPFLTEADRIACVAEGLAVYAGHVACPELRRAAGRALALCWGLPPTSADSLLDAHCPSVAYGGGSGSGSLSLCVGSVTLPVAPLLASALAEAGRSAAPPLPAAFVPTRHALWLLERLAACVAMEEPALLVGETGCGKTSVIQALATAAGARLRVCNLNVQTDSADLLGGYKPVHLKQMAVPLLGRFEALFERSFGAGGGGAFAAAVRAAVHSEQWPRFIGAVVKAVAHVREAAAAAAAGEGESGLNEEWEALACGMRQFERQFTAANAAAAPGGSEGGDSNGGGVAGMAFSFMEGILVDALRTGCWLLLDEINLASAETLQRLAGVLEGGSITLSERGDTAPIPRHPQLPPFCCHEPSHRFWQTRPAARAAQQVC